MITIVYRLIALLIIVAVFRDFWSEKTVSGKICACMVMIPLALRVLMIK
jgi:hypothetical protein